MNNLLKQLYWINSPSGSEQGMSGFIRSCLDDMGIDFETDEYFQIFSLSKPDRPIICCHIDQIGDEPICQLIEKDGIITGDKNIGADDKNGIWICLNLLCQFPDLNFIFSTCEEIRGNIHHIVNDIDISDFPYCLVFDRKGSGDIIGAGNDYCNFDFEKAISEIGLLFGFSPAQGIFSDCNELSHHINCVNLSCGYYNAHTDTEYTVIAELENSLEFAKEILTDEKLNSQKFETECNDYFGYDEEPPEYIDHCPVCPYCKQDLVDFVEGKSEGFLCQNCQYEYILDYNEFYH